jgi:hypothetical protein
MKFELDDYTRKMLAWLAVTVVTILISTFLGVKYPVPAPPAFDSPMPLGVTHLTGLAIGDGTPDLAAGDDDVYVEGDLEVDDEIEADGAIDADSTLSVAGAASFASDVTLSADLSVADDIAVTDDISITGKFVIDSAANEIPLRIQAYTTPTTNLLVVEDSSGTDIFWVTQNGDVEMNGTTPLLTIGDAGTEDTAIVFDGQAQDFHIGLDDTADDLVVGKGSALGTTTAFAIDENQVTTWSGGTLLLTEAKSAADTLTASECGKTIFMSGDDYTLTLPAVSGVSAGCEFRFIVASAPTTDTVILTGNSDEDVLIGGINELEVDTNDDGPYDANADTLTFVGGTAVVGDFVYMISDGSYFYVSGQANADGGITITDSD